jgi:metal-responsive CopG/Arc/MetJ family transcriptional regulator
VSAKKRSISAPEELFQEADARWKRLRYKKFSQYIQELIESDVENRPAHGARTERQPKPNPAPATKLAQLAKTRAIHSK